MLLLERLALVDILPKVNWFALISDFLALNLVTFLPLTINNCYHHYNVDLNKIFYFMH